ncbi:sugar-transfer associated ATP-grasp domain-containing protein [Sphingomicrobium sp. XHP0235]|uniref:sugar-transfer associated ATP-grasp domain-containing protein n=1 Tax=Sphingomicrobium aquimarinum TaxID=3133971 RepID=UPI0031FF358C
MSVLGMNARNALIARVNPRHAIRRVNDKWETKERLAAHGVPVPRTLALIENRDELAHFDVAALPDAFAVKPNRGRRGEGILLSVARRGECFVTPGDALFGPDYLVNHVSHILDGEMSLEGAFEDRALIEPLIRTHDSLARLVPYGLPDIRIICYRDTPLIGMARLPTEASGGKANLHQGAVGAALDMGSGTVTRAVDAKRAVTHHPSTGELLVGYKMPFWAELMDAAIRCSAALELGYVGVDLVIDATEGVKVLECNAFPGLEIQNINARGIAQHLRQVRREERRARAN